MFSSVSMENGVVGTYQVDVDRKKKEESAEASSHEEEKSPTGRVALSADLFANPDEEDQEEKARIKAEKEKSTAVDMNAVKTTFEDAVLAAKHSEAPTFRSEGLFWRYNPEWKYDTPPEERICKRVPVKMWEHDEPSQVLIKVEDLKFALPNVEPFYASLTLFDLARGVRLSEAFYFDLNNPDAVLSGVLEVARRCADEITLAKHCIFSVDDRHDGVHLVLRVEHVLQGDADSAVEPYTKTKQLAQDKIDALKGRVVSSISRLAEYKQPFAWGVCQLYDDMGNVVDEGERQIAPLYLEKQTMSDEELVKAAREVLTAEKIKAKSFPDSSFTFRVQELDFQLPPNRVDPSSILLKDTADPLPLTDSEEKSNPVVKEVLKFENPETTTVLPHDQFINLLYVYPKEVSFQKFRNIACRVQIRTNDSSLDQEGVKVILGHSSCSAFSNSQMTQVNYHNKQPSLKDEVKVMLPLSLSTKAHVFFTFYQISCKKKTGKKTAEIIGYSALPLYPDPKSMRGMLPEVANMGDKKGFVSDGRYEIPIAASLPDNYLMPFMERKETDQVHFRNDGKPCFSVDLKLVSSVFNQDPHLNDFFQSFPSAQELDRAGTSFANDMLKECVEHLRLAESAALVRFMPSILNYLTEVIATRPEAAFHAFVGLIVVIKKIDEFRSEGVDRCSLLAAFVRFRFNNVEGSPLYSSLLQVWNRGLELRDQLLTEDQEVEENVRRDRMAASPTFASKATQNLFKKAVLRYSWFFFEVCFKSLAIERQDQGKLSRKEEFMDSFDGILSSFINVLYDHRKNLIAAKTLNQNLALFFTDLFYVLEDDLVTSMIKSFVDEFRSDLRVDPVLVPFQFTFFEIMFGSENFIDVQQPRDFRVTEQNASDVIEALRDRFPIPAMFADSIGQNLSFMQKDIQAVSVDTLRKIIATYDFDEQYRKVKAPIATMFLPLVPTLCAVYEAEVDVIEKMNSRTKRNLLISLLWIIKNCNRTALRAWWRGETDGELLVQFVHLLEMAMSEFQYYGYEHRKNNPEFETILAPESTFNMDDSRKGTIGDFKDQIESLMTGVNSRHSHWRQGVEKGGSLDRRALKALRPSINPPGGRSGTLRSQRSSITSSASKTGTAGKSTLRQMRAALADKARKNTLKRNVGNTLTVNSRDFLVNLLKMEAALNASVCQVVLSVVLDLLRDKDRLVEPENDEDMTSACLSLFLSCVEFHHCNEFYLAVLPCLRYFMNRHGVQVFKRPNLYAQLVSLLVNCFCLLGEMLVLVLCL